MLATGRELCDRERAADSVRGVSLVEQDAVSCLGFCSSEVKTMSCPSRPNRLDGGANRCQPAASRSDKLHGDALCFAGPGDSAADIPKGRVARPV